MKTLISLFLLLILFASCDNPTTIQTGTIYATVVDYGNAPVSNIKITILPDSLIKTTNVNGICKFEIEPGSYLVTAHLTGPGPADRFYKKLVEVEKYKTVKLKLTTCPYCQ